MFTFSSFKLILWLGIGLMYLRVGRLAAMAVMRSRPRCAHARERADNLSSCSAALQGDPAGTGGPLFSNPVTPSGGAQSLRTPQQRKTILGRRLQKYTTAETRTLLFLLWLFGVERLLRSSPCDGGFRQEEV